MHLNGVGVAQDNDTAIAMFEKAADGGVAAAHNGLGVVYLHGYGVDVDAARAVEHFERAAEAVGEGALARTRARTHSHARAHACAHGRRATRRRTATWACCT